MGKDLSQRPQAHFSLSLAFAVVFLLTMLGSDIIAHLKQLPHLLSFKPGRLKD